MALIFDSTYNSDEAIWNVYFEYAYSLTEGKLPEVVNKARKLKNDNPKKQWEDIIREAMKESGCSNVPSNDDFEPMFVIITSDVDFDKRI